VAKTVFIKTYGCQMNAYDSERMGDVLAPLGFDPTDRAEAADMVVLNTCHIREKAAEKVFSKLGRLGALKRDRRAQGQDLMIVVAGCVAQADGTEILRRAPQVDIVVGPQAYHRLPELVERAAQGGAGVIDLEFPLDSKFERLPVSARASGATAFLSVQEGCDKFCTFCVVPYTRGVEYSRPVAAVAAEARRLVAAGVREITLLGQNVNAYHGQAPALTPGAAREWGLGRLLRHLAGIEGLARIRYSTSHPSDMNDDLIAAHGEVEALMPYLHLPVQSGSDPILRAMNRGYTADFYLRLIDRLRAVRPDLALSSDFIVGFPGETEADHAATLALVRRVEFAQAYSFKFSPRPGTPAANLPAVPEAQKIARLDELQALLRHQQEAFNRAAIGRLLPVLFTGPGRHGGQQLGRSPYCQAVHVATDADLAGRILEVRMRGVKPNSLLGELAAVGGMVPRQDARVRA